MPIWVTALAGLVAGPAAPVVDQDAAAYAAAYPAEDATEAGYHLALWHGFGLPLLFSALALAGGLLIHRFRETQARAAGFSPLDAQHGYEVVVRELDEFAQRLTGRLQVGSLPAYLGTILAAVILLPGLATLLNGWWPDDQPLYHSLAQVPLALIAVVAALAVVRAHRRFTAVLLVGVIGYSVGGLFVVEGAPDLALAQFLVETLTMVAFVFVLRRLPSHFTEKPTSRRARIPQVVIATLGGVVVATTAVVRSGARVGPPAASAAFIENAYEGAGAYNVISAILVEFRALDTVVEIGVLFIAAAGVASLVLATRYDRRKGPGEQQEGADAAALAVDEDPDHTPGVDPTHGDETVGPSSIVPDGRTSDEKTEKNGTTENGTTNGTATSGAPAGKEARA